MFPFSCELVTVANYERLCQRRAMLEAEGYLELIVSFEPQWTVSRAVRTRLCQRALERLDFMPARSCDQLQIWYLTGLAYQTMCRYRPAIDVYQRIVRKDPDHVPAWLNLGWCYKRTGRLDMAIRALEQALNVEPEEAIIHYNLACYWSLAGNKDLALKYLARSLQLDPQYRNLIAREPDFDPIRELPDFQNVTGLSA